MAKASRKVISHLPVSLTSETFSFAASLIRLTRPHRRVFVNRIPAGGLFQFQAQKLHCVDDIEDSVSCLGRRRRIVCGFVSEPRRPLLVLTAGVFERVWPQPVSRPSLLPASFLPVDWGQPRHPPSPWLGIQHELASPLANSPSTAVKCCQESCRPVIALSWRYTGLQGSFNVLSAWKCMDGLEEDW